MRYSFFLPFFFLCTTLLHGQGNYTVSGYAEDSDSRERIIGVNLYLEGSSIGTTSNTFGFY